MVGPSSLAGKITSLVACLSIAITLAAGYYMVKTEYQARKSRLIESFEHQVKSAVHQFQIAIYFRDTTVLEQLTANFARDNAIDYAMIYDHTGKTVSETIDPAHSAVSTPSLEIVRNDFDGYDTAYVTRTDQLTNANYVDLTLPVFTLASPVDTRINRKKYTDLITSQEAKQSRHFAGYMRLGINEQQLRGGITVFARKVATLGGGIVLASILLAWETSRRITKPLSKLVKAAEDISHGKLDTKFSLTGSSEVREISTYLNMIVESIASHKTQVEVDNQLLSLKVNERTTELSERNEELNRAIEEANQAKNRMKQLAYLDSLTSLPNRRFFTEQLETLLQTAKYRQHSLALLFIDLDNFKRINDSLGHNAGDLLLKECAARLSSCVRASDLTYLDTGETYPISRFGGDEFTVVLNQIDQPESAGTIAERLLEALSQPIIIDNQEFVITPSIGIALAPEHGSDCQTLLKHADTAMYHAKKQGKNSYQYYSSDMEQADIARLQLETDLRKALQREELELHYQPQVDVVTGEIAGAEVLLRWHHSKKGYISPVEFIAVAEEIGIIGELGEWVLEQACEQMKMFQEDNLPVPQLSVNVSSLQFNDDFGRRLQNIICRTGLDPQAIVVELTEGIIMHNVHETIARLRELRDIGVRLSVDDFGTGYSSLSYLSRFPLNELKIDKSFIIDFDKSKNKTSLVLAIIAMGKSLNLELVAEGIETEEQFLFLKENGVRVVQGYLFSKPLPMKDFHSLLKSHNFPEKIQEISSDKRASKVA
ncbi:MAG TPA: hypothetical protein DCZ13_11605 [Porticoccaceae bacterium]|nr:hypothetical protein [Porticoccaceae bacterium]